MQFQLQRMILLVSSVYHQDFFTFSFFLYVVIIHTISVFHKGTGEASFPEHIKRSRAAKIESQKVRHIYHPLFGLLQSIKILNDMLKMLYQIYKFYELIEWQNADCEMEDDYQKLLTAYECQQRELTEMRKTVEELNRGNQVKTKECQNALKSMQDLQSELMRKSMHVGSLGKEID